MNITNDQELLKSLESIENLVSKLEIKLANKIGLKESELNYLEDQLGYIKVHAITAQEYVKATNNQVKELKKALGDLLNQYEGVYDSVKPDDTTYQSEEAKLAENNALNILLKYA